MKQFGVVDTESDIAEWKAAAERDTPTSQRGANLKAAFAEHNIPWPKDATIFWHPTGPKISYGGGMLKIDDLNPEAHIQFRMSAREMLRLGWRCIVIAWRIR